ncbi:MAG: hypothetical protein IKZ58_03180 [Selenomonadaceae bacterium]|nr:hypothetical protein [Selenomonadaceae bacterium]
MSEKDTEELENELAETDDLKKFFAENELNLRNFTLAQYLSYLLVTKNLSKAEVIKRSELGDYAYHIFSGRKNTSREKIISLALAMQLSFEECQHLLYYAGAKQLYARDSWDDVIIYALKNNLTVTQTNELLIDFDESPLLGNVE